jgi:ubiquitin C-terminal hydrolase
MDLLCRTSDKLNFGFQIDRNSRFPIRYPGPESMYEYDLFAVINHEGQINNGHYTNFARFQDEVSIILNGSYDTIGFNEFPSVSGIGLTTTSKNFI